MVNDKEDYEEEDDDESAVFNMAISTLKALSLNLEEIRKLNYRVDLNLETIQTMKVGLVRQFFIRSSPLLPKLEVKKYQKEVLALKPYREPAYSRMGFMTDRHFLGNKLTYNEYLDNRMDEILIELQLILQQEKYFMPTNQNEDEYT